MSYIDTTSSANPTARHVWGIPRGGMSNVLVSTDPKHPPTRSAPQRGPVAEVSLEGPGSAVESQWECAVNRITFRVIIRRIRDPCKAELP